MKRGFTFVELLATLGIASSIAIIDMHDDNMLLHQDRAKELGTEIYEYNNAISRFISAYSGDPQGELGLTPSTPLTYIGSSWLKHSSCSDGLSSTAFLSCLTLPNEKTIQFEIQPTTTITLDTNNEIEARTVWSKAVGNDGSSDSLAMGLAAMAASAQYLSQAESAQSATQLPTIFCPEVTSYSPEIARHCLSDKGNIISRVSTNSNLDTWLRTDHGNTMTHALEFGSSITNQAQIDAVDDGEAYGSWGGANMRQIINVARIYNIGSTGSDSLVLGTNGGKAILSDPFLSTRSLLRNSVIFQDNIGVTNDLFIKGDTEVSDSTNVQGDMTSAGRISTDGHMQVSRDITTNSGSILANNGLAEAAYIRSTQDSIASNNIYADRYYDRNNTSFYLDPSSRSQVDSITASGDARAPIFYDSNNTGYYFNPSARSVMKDVTARGDMRAPVFFDQDNTTYRGDFSGTSRTNYIDSNEIVSRGRMRTDEYLRLNRTVSSGASCSPNGILAKLSNGALANCANGKWKQAGSVFDTINTTKLSRGQTYTNTTGKPMFLAYRAQAKPYRTVQIIVNGRTVAHHYLSDIDGGDFRAAFWWSPTAIVPAGGTYRIEGPTNNYTTTRIY